MIKLLVEGVEGDVCQHDVCWRLVVGDPFVIHGKLGQAPNQLKIRGCPADVLALRHGVVLTW